MEKLLLSPEEASEILDLGRCTVYDLIRQKKLVSIKIGRRRLVPLQACRDMVDQLITEQQDAA